MVKRKRIAGKPGQPSPAADSWVKRGGSDPEVQPFDKGKEPDVEAEDEGKPYPHRVSFDMASPQYKRLKRAAFEEGRSMNEILREAMEDWLKTHNY